MNETTDWFRFALGLYFSIVIALLLYAALGTDHGKLRDEIAALHAEFRCFAEQEDCDVARLSALDRRR